MSTVKIWKTGTDSPEQTEQLAEKIGANLHGGEVLELVSDLGGGKTTFTRGLVRGADSNDQVGSPTFTLSREYNTPRFTVAHFDFYRLNEAGIVADELAEIEGDPNYVTVVEWGDIVHDVLPEDRLTIRLSLTGDNSRDIEVSYTDNLAHLLKGIK